MTRITELTPLLKRLQLGPMAATLPERIALARREQLDYASFLEIICHCSGSLGHDMLLSSDSVRLNGKRKCPRG